MKTDKLKKGWRLLNRGRIEGRNSAAVIALVEGLEAEINRGQERQQGEGDGRFRHDEAAVQVIGKKSELDSVVAEIRFGVDFPHDRE